MTSLYVVVVGCGRLGSHVANLLSRHGHRVVVVDRDDAAFTLLSSESFSGYRIQGDASEPAVLRRAEVGRANLLIAATQDDNVNLMVTIVAQRVFGVRRVMARVYDPRREEAYRSLGLATVCPTLLAGEVLLMMIHDTLDGERGTQ